MIVARILFPIVKTNIMMNCEGCWTLLCYTWYAFTIVGAHISPELWAFLKDHTKS